MRPLLLGRGGAYRLCWWHDPWIGPAEAAEPFERFSDASSALAFARRLAAGAGTLGRIRAFLADDLGKIHLLDDHEVIQRLATHLAGGRIVASRVAQAPLHGVDATESEPPPRIEAAVRVEPKTWIEIELIGMDDLPIPGERYEIALPTGEVRSGVLDMRGRARVDGIDPGTCEVTFPALDEEAWERL